MTTPPKRRETEKRIFLPRKEIEEIKIRDLGQS